MVECSRLPSARGHAAHSGALGDAERFRLVGQELAALIREHTDVDGHVLRAQRLVVIVVTCRGRCRCRPCARPLRRGLAAGFALAGSRRRRCMRERCR